MSVTEFKNKISNCQYVYFLHTNDEFNDIYAPSVGLSSTADGDLYKITENENEITLIKVEH